MCALDRVELECILGLFWEQATVYAVIYSAKQKDFRIFLYDNT